jgi:predicted MPP superfamily phosphohydrolase
VRDRVITIGGATLYHPDGRPDALRDELEARPGDRDIRILLTHRPDAVLNLPSPSRTDLVVAGHTHGGQVALPFFGPVMTLTEVPRDVAAGGLFDLGGRHILVGRGVGRERFQAPPVRLGVPPNIPIVRLDS